MKQSRATSFLKSLVSTAVGFGVAFLANMIILPWFGLPISHSANLLLTAIYTVISIARGFALERVYEAMGWRTRMSAFALAVLAERQRHPQEGYDVAHDDKHSALELALAAAAYAVVDDDQPKGCELWPWRLSEFRPDGKRNNWKRSGALLIAAGDHLDRNRKRRPLPSGYQPADGSRPPPPVTSSGVVSLAHSKSRSEHAGAPQ